MKTLVKASIFLVGTISTNIVFAGCFHAYVSATSSSLTGKIVTVSAFDTNTKQLVQSWQLQIEGDTPSHNSICIDEDGNYIVRYTGVGMAWQEYQNLALNSLKTQLQIRMEPGEDGHVMLVSKPYVITDSGACSPSSDSTDSPVASHQPSIAANLNLHIPRLDYQSLGGTMNLWVDLKFNPTDDGKMWWVLGDYGVNP
jgi:hypothetical protein